MTAKETMRAHLLPYADALGCLPPSETAVNVGFVSPWLAAPAHEEQDDEGAARLSKHEALRGQVYATMLEPDNLQLLCPTCNCSKKAMHPGDFMRRLGLLL